MKVSTVVDEGTRTNPQSGILCTLLVVNRAGGLVYNKDLSPGLPRMSTNDHMRSASTFHSLYAISSQLAPVTSSGIEAVDTDSFALQCFQTPTGIKFIVSARPGARRLDEFLRKIYELYADYVLKNPFYETDQPIRCDKFDSAIEAYVKAITPASLH